MQDVLFLSFVTALISFTVTETKLFKIPREWLQKKYHLLGDLLSSGYYLGFLVAFVFVAIYRPRIFNLWWPLDYFLAVLVVTWLSCFQWVVMCWLIKKAEK